ncbi:hypothetical protein [Streptomyces griseus]|uniref:hypothetical protein n=1 Tax=Streptomyces griseus TaxID=1911 RepID=UPI0008404B97|nr:hypothetical protein [Streptomyces griseus]
MRRPGRAGRTRGGASATARPVGAPATVRVTGAWTGPASTHDTRPALTAPVPGTVTDALFDSTGSSVDRIAPAPAGAVGSGRPLAPAGSGTDRPRVRSSEVSAACGPQLVLTFGAER